MEEGEVPRDMPMHYAYFTKNEECSLPDSEIESRIPNSVREAKTFEELYTSLANMKIELESNPTIESVDVTMDVPDVPTGDEEEVMVNFDIREKHGLSTNLLMSTSKEQNDYSIGINGVVSNPTNHLDSLTTVFSYDVIHQNHMFSAVYAHPRGFFGLPLSLAYLKTYNNYLQESGVSVYRDYVHATVSNRKGSVSARCFFGLRDLTPQGDLEEEKILHSHCSRSMLNECHPSVASGVSVAYKYNTEDDELLPTEGSRLKSTLTWNGLVGDVHSVQFSVSGATTLPIIPEIAEEPGLLVHLKGMAGMNCALGKKRIRFVDRYFLNATHVHGYTRKDFGPRSKPEEGGRKEGDALGGDTCCALSAAVSLPVVLSMDYSYGIRAKLFYEIGNVWNHASTSWRDIWNSSRSCLGAGVSLPLFGSVLMDVSYLINQKRFAFSISVL